MELSDQGYEVLLQHLSPADTAALRLVSRSWQVWFGVHSIMALTGAACIGMMNKL
jgi:hypothetical protein